MDDESAVVNALNSVTLTGPVNVNVPAPQTRDHYFARAQWLPSEMQAVSLNYTFTDHSSENNGVGALNLPEQGVTSWRRTHRVQLIESAAFSPQFRNEIVARSEEHTSELQSPCNLVCRLLLEKKKKSTVI